MTNLELLDKVISTTDFTSKDYQKLRNELKVLELLKKHLFVKCIGESWLYDIVCDLSEAENEADNENFNKIKEWLENG